jgi:alanine racemase
MDMIRPGLALYGCHPTPDGGGTDRLELRPVMALKCRVAAVRELPDGTPVSYGGAARVREGAGRVAVLPVGYADGLQRVLSNRGQVYLGGGLRPVLGRICMDMCMVELDERAGVHPGDVAELFGPHLPVEEPAGLAGTISYELLCGVAPRVPRILLESGPSPLPGTPEQTLHIQ